MLDVVHMWNDEVEAFYSEQITNQKRIYSQRFAKTPVVIVVVLLQFFPIHSAAAKVLKWQDWPVVLCEPSVFVYSSSQKNSLRFSDIFPHMVGNF